MSEITQVSPLGQPWAFRRVTVFHGQRDTHISTGEDYETRSLGDIFAMSPGDADKGNSLACIPSTYHDYDARNHAAQRERGIYVMLCADIDSGDHPLARIEELVRQLVGEHAFLIYSSAHAQPGDMRWRVLIPIDTPCNFEAWHDAQNALFNYLEYSGVEVDRAMDRAGQPVFLPNVPKVHAKTGEDLRDEWNCAIYYKRATSGATAPALPIDTGAIAQGIDAIKRKRDEDEKERARIRREIEAKRAARPQNEGASVMADFNANSSIASLLELYGYQQSPRNPDDWRSPKQTGESYATRIIGDKWVSLSMSDAAAMLGDTCATGCYGDAYDLFVHYEHSGDHKAAFRALYAERRAAQPQSWSAPPPPDPDDPGPGEDILDGPADMIEIAELSAEDVAGEIEQCDPLVKATPFVWRDTAAIPRREWLYGKHLLRKFVSVDVAAGGVGKSSLKIGEALAMASGRDIYNKGLPEGALTVWLWNLEDPIDEIERRVHATMERFKMLPADLGYRFFADSGRDQPLIMATEGPDGAKIVRPVVDALIAEMIDRKIDVLIVDPFISSHAVSENDNNAIDIVAREWNIVAERTGASINLVHHVRKGNGAEANADSARGASSLIGKARSVLVYNRMTEDDAAKLNVPPAERFFYFRTDNDKANLAPPERGIWYRMNNVDLANGDSVGVACPWTPPDAFDGLTPRHLYKVQKAISEGRWRENIQTKDAWVGNAVATALELNAEEKHTRRRIQTLLHTWIQEGALDVVEEEDAQRRMRKFVVVGKWVQL